MKRICALDFGFRRIGWALSDMSQILVASSGAFEYHATENVIGVIQTLIKEKSVEKIVLGYPLNMQGEKTKQTESTIKFQQTLEKVISIPIELFDERLSSVQAGRNLHKMGIRTGHQKGKVDAMAASLILETWLQRKAFRSHRE